MATSQFPGLPVTVQTATAGALTGDGTSGNKLAVSVDGSTITVNGSDQLEASGTFANVNAASVTFGSTGLYLDNGAVIFSVENVSGNSVNITSGTKTLLVFDPLDALYLGDTTVPMEIDSSTLNVFGSVTLHGNVTAGSSANVLVIPTIDPHVLNALWLDSATIKVSAG